MKIIVRDKLSDFGMKNLTFTFLCHDGGVGVLVLGGDSSDSQYEKIVQEMLDSIQWLWFDRVLHRERFIHQAKLAARLSQVSLFLYFEHQGGGKFTIHRL